MNILLILFLSIVVLFFYKNTVLHGSCGEGCKYTCKAKNCPHLEVKTEKRKFVKGELLSKKPELHESVPLRYGSTMGSEHIKQNTCSSNVNGFNKMQKVNEYNTKEFLYCVKGSNNPFDK